MTLLQETHTVHRDSEYVRTQIARIVVKSKENPKEVFTSLYHLLNEAMFIECHQELEANKATGIDKVTKQEYSANLEENIQDLVKRLKSHTYRPQPVRRVYIPKGNGEQRPLGIPTYEDKLVQMGLSKILTAIYDPCFIEQSYGFRVGKSAHEALRKLNEIIRYKPINYIVDADIKGFFNNVKHEWVVKFIQHRIKDPNIIKLLKKMLMAGTIEAGKYVKTEKGMPQGSIVSPILSNIYLHYVLDIWFEKRIRKCSDGESEIVRYADDFVCCFKYEGDTRRFLTALEQRLKKFGLELATDKTRTILFGKYANERVKKIGLKRPETFDFLGFTHYCSLARNKQFALRVQTSSKKYRAKLKGLKLWLKKAVHVITTKDIIDRVNTILRGYYNYYCVRGNSQMVRRFRSDFIKLIYKWLNRRGQRNSFTWDKFNVFLKYNPIIYPKVVACISVD